MSFRLPTLSLLILAACSGSDGSPSQDPLFLPPGGGGEDQLTGSEWLMACGGSIRELGAGACSRTEQGVSATTEATVGVTAEAFLQLIRGEHRAQVAWRDEGEPTGSSSELVLTVQPQGDVRFVDQTLSSAGRSETITFGNTGGRYYTCGDHLAVDAELTVMMPDGSLNETVQATIEAESGRHARVLVRVPSRNLVGTLRTLVERDGADQLTLALGISELGTGLEGSLGAGHSQASASPEGGPRCSLLGSFSLANGCPLGAYPLSGTEEVAGLSYVGALARLNATSPTTLGDNGAALSLTFSAEPAQRCVSIDTPASLTSVLEFPGSVTLESSDGRVGGTLEVRLTAEAMSDRLQVVEASSNYLVPDPSGLTALAPSYAILEPLSWAPLEMGGFDFRVEAHEQASGGLLRAIGGNLSCQSSRPCEEVCPGPGCTMSPAEKWAVRWGEMHLDPDVSLRGR